MKPFSMWAICLMLVFTITSPCLLASASQIALAEGYESGSLILFDGAKVAPIFLDAGACEAVGRAADDLAEDFTRVTAAKPKIERQISPDEKFPIIIGPLGQSQLVDQLVIQGRPDVSGAEY